MTDLLESPKIYGVSAWADNATLIAHVASLGWLKETEHTLDPTWVDGLWWKRWRPLSLVGTDLYKDAPDGNFDFCRMPWDDGVFGQVTFDPPYVAKGGRTTSTIDQMDKAYGMREAPKTPALLQDLIHAGMEESWRVLRTRGILLVKAKDYISSGKLWEGSTKVRNFAVEELGMRVEDYFIHQAVGGGPQPKTNPDGSPRRQVHAVRNSSTLWVFRKL